MMPIKDPVAVYFIGAGPGDPDLLTLKAKDILAYADVVLYDFLAHPGCLAHTPPTCRRVCVGKRKGQHGKTQTQINALMRKYALSGARVVRLKGGDPMVFGRMGEEMETLKKAGIPYGIVPGISSIQGAACGTGIPLTHRAHARSFAILTGTTWQRKTLSNSEIPDADMLLVFMPNTHLETLLTTIVTHTRHHWDSHVAIVTSASTAAQHVRCTTLKELHKSGLKNTSKHPVMLMIGDSVAQHAHYAWQQHMPLHGWRLFLTAETLPTTPQLTLLKRMGLEVCHLPMVYTTALQVGQRWQSLPRNKTDLMVFCSPRAVSRFFEILAEQQVDIRQMSGQIAAVGQQTAQCLRGHGLYPTHVPQSRFGAEGLLGELPSDMKGQRVHVYGAKKLATDLIGQLRQRNARVQHHALYHTRTRPHAPVLAPFETQDILLFSSPSQVDSFIHHYGAQAAPAQILTLGNTTHGHCQAYFHTTTLHQSPTASYDTAFQYILHMIMTPVSPE